MSKSARTTAAAAASSVTAQAMSSSNSNPTTNRRSESRSAIADRFKSSTSSTTNVAAATSAAIPTDEDDEDDIQNIEITAKSKKSTKSSTSQQKAKSTSTLLAATQSEKEKPKSISASTSATRSSLIVTPKKQEEKLSKKKKTLQPALIASSTSTTTKTPTIPTTTTNTTNAKRSSTTDIDLPKEKKLKKSTSQSIVAATTESLSSSTSSSSSSASATTSNLAKSKKQKQSSSSVPSVSVDGRLQHSNNTVSTIDEIVSSLQLKPTQTTSKQNTITTSTHESKIKTKPIPIEIEIESNRSKPKQSNNSCATTTLNESSKSNKAPTKAASKKNNSPQPLTLPILDSVKDNKLVPSKSSSTNNNNNIKKSKDKNQPLTQLEPVATSAAAGILEEEEEETQKRQQFSKPHSEKPSKKEKNKGSNNNNGDKKNNQHVSKQFQKQQGESGVVVLLPASTALDESFENYDSSECSIIPQGTNYSTSFSLSSVSSDSFPLLEGDDLDLDNILIEIQQDEEEPQLQQYPPTGIIHLKQTNGTTLNTVGVSSSLFNQDMEKQLESGVEIEIENESPSILFSADSRMEIEKQQLLKNINNNIQQFPQINRIGVASGVISGTAGVVEEVESLIEIKSVDDEYYETRELPKDKTRFLWIVNCVRFIDMLTNSSASKIDSSVFRSGNGRSWRLEITHNERNEELVCVVRGIGESSKQQMQVTVKMWVISDSDATVERSGSSTKTFSTTSDSHAFSFAFEIEKVLEKYQHVIFEVTLAQLRLISHNSKEETGYVGILNEGMTCYINSFLQTLFHLKAFVRLVYSYPTSRLEEPTFPHTLQELFYELQDQPYQCSTASLLKSFAWDRSRARIQQDVQEFSCLFIEFLEKKAETIPHLRGKIKQLFQGTISSYIKCINVSYSSVSSEQFFDISLNLKGCRDIYESLDDYVREEMLEGENKYDTGTREFGKQDAKKGTRLQQLPPVLFFHLKRFQFDQHSAMNVKISDAHKYYEEIDLRAYMAAPDPAASYKYSLFAVLVHAGDMAQSGHYYAYIRPTTTANAWFKFNDAIVEKASTKQALDNNFGGKAYFKQFDKTKKAIAWESVQMNSTAYMLVYIKSQDIERVLAPIPETIIPKWVKAIVDEDSNSSDDESLKQKSKFITVRMTTFDYLKKQSQSCAVYFQKQAKRDDCVETNESIIFKRDVERGRRFHDFYTELCSDFGLETEDITLWKIEYIPNTNGTPGGTERITNETKRMAQSASMTIESFYWDGVSPQSATSTTSNHISNNNPSTQSAQPQFNAIPQTTTTNTTTTTSTPSHNQNNIISTTSTCPPPIYLILPVSSGLRFGGNKPLFSPIPPASINTSESSLMIRKYSEQQQQSHHSQSVSSSSSSANNNNNNNNLAVGMNSTSPSHSTNTTTTTTTTIQQKKRIQPNDWQRFFTFQGGQLMLVIVKTFEYTRSEGVRIQFMDYVFMKPDATFFALCEEITKRFPSIDSQNYFRESEYGITELNLEKQRTTPLRTIFNSADAGVLIIPFDSKLARDHQVSIHTFYKQLDDAYRIKFTFYPMTAGALNSGSTSAASPKTIPLQQSSSHVFQTSQQQSTQQQQQQQQPNLNSTNSHTPNASRHTGQSKTHDVDLSTVITTDDLMIEVVVNKKTKYSQLQSLLFEKLKESFRKHVITVEDLNSISNSSNNMNNIHNISNNQNANNNNPLNGSLHETTTTHDIVALETMKRFLTLDASCSEFLFFKISKTNKSKKTVLDDIAFALPSSNGISSNSNHNNTNSSQNSNNNNNNNNSSSNNSNNLSFGIPSNNNNNNTNNNNNINNNSTSNSVNNNSNNSQETTVGDLARLVDNSSNMMSLAFDLSRNLRARERDQRVIVSISYFSNAEMTTWQTPVNIEVDKNGNYAGIVAAIKNTASFKEFHNNEITKSKNAAISNSANVTSSNNSNAASGALQVRICSMSRENPNRIEFYLSESAKVATVKNNLLRVELQPQANNAKEGEILMICHVTTRNGIETLASPFAFAFSKYRSVRRLRACIVESLEKRSANGRLVYDGKRVEFNRDAILVTLNTEYSKYHASKFVLEPTNERQIAVEVDIESLTHSTAFVEIQLTHLISPTDSRAIKFN